MIRDGYCRVGVLGSSMVLAILRECFSSRCTTGRGRRRQDRFGRAAVSRSTEGLITLRD